MPTSTEVKEYSDPNSDRQDLEVVLRTKTGQIHAVASAVWSSHNPTDAEIMLHRRHGRGTRGEQTFHRCASLEGASCDFTHLGYRNEFPLRWRNRVAILEQVLKEKFPTMAWHVRGTSGIKRSKFTSSARLMP